MKTNTEKASSEAPRHTPGPWKSDPAHLTTICSGYSTVGEAALTWGLGKAIANASLIAAAPELLAEVRMIAAIAAGMLSEDAVSPDWSIVLKDARAAIAKALGKAS